MDFFRLTTVLVIRTTLFNRPFIPKNGYNKRGVERLGSSRVSSIMCHHRRCYYYYYYYLLLYPRQTGIEKSSYCVHIFYEHVIHMLGIRFENFFKNKRFFRPFEWYIMYFMMTDPYSVPLILKPFFYYYIVV